MDKVKTFLALLKKHHFWVMTGTVVLLSCIGWFLATSQLWGEYKTNRETIEAKFTALGKIKSEERENQKWIDGLDDQTKKLKVKVRKAWDKVYIEQKTNVLKWPEFLGPNAVARLERLGPTENIPRDICRQYHNYLQNEFPRLLEIVDARDERDERKGAGGARAPVEAAEPRAHKLTWDAANQKEIFEKLNFSGVPNSNQVRETQEDLWVYHALLKIIANLNEFATGNYNAKVKEIQTVLIGSDAAKEFQDGMSEGHLEKPEGAVSASKPAGAMVVAANPSAGPVVGRYVDEKGSALAEGGAVPAEFKRMPIVMRLVMDQREILRLLVECANSPLPVEVRHVHVHAKKVAAKGAGQGGGADKDLNSYDMVVEVSGLIYIFNPPDPTKLGEVAAGDVNAAPAVEPPVAAPRGGAPQAEANPAAADPAVAPADGGKPAAQPDAAAGKPDAAAINPDAAAEPENMEKTDGMKDDEPGSN